MLSRSSSRPNSAGNGRRSFSDGGLFADERGVIHIRISHARARRGNRKTTSYRASFVSLHCERGGVGVGEVTAVPTRLSAFPTCVRCLAMELDHDP